ncbi:MAG: hypothetical protein IKQ37_01655 [Bacteroidaceae bacterium]|nr:hypothetical protein [Bacteroidaceae bacterium]
MFLIEPCCTQKHWPALRERIGEDGTIMFHGYGDLSLEELLPVVLTRYSEVDMMLVCPSLPNATAGLLLKWLERKWADGDGDSTHNIISRLAVLTDLRKKKSPTASAWLKNNPYPGRLILHDVQQNDTAILLPDLAVHGAFNLVPNGHFTAIASTNANFIANLKEVYSGLVRRRDL